MVELSTPTKQSKIDCFICFSKEVVTFKLAGRKLLAEDFNSKLNEILGAKVVGALCAMDAAVCRNCYGKVLKLNDFLHKTRSSASSYIATGASTTKKGMLSPITPKSLAVTDSVSTVRGTSRKQLKLFQLSKDIDFCVSVPEEVPFFDQDHDHSYVTMQEAGHDDVKEKQTLQCLTDIFTERENVKEGDILRTLRSQSFQLTTKSVPFGSVLYFKGPNQVVEKEDLIFDIISELKTRLPFLLQVFMTIAVPNSQKIKPSIIPVLASCYAILMKNRSQYLTVYHKMTSAIAAEAGLDDDRVQCFYILCT
ncbi:uncharacterized protein LOC130055197 [Ostrea edulis]|uniref:uncharacterized protein LOC130055197 n=1 Tax=Ostrea edulis TaxID=37623 RepID=UPI0024AF763E|nr:uncharacterized protein LOC130055197 [Ostrea edulis]